MLKDGDFKIVYSTGEDEPISFYIEALMESNNLDLGLGFFSSSGFKVLSHGFAYFLSRGGNMRLIINNVLTSRDKEAIEKGQGTTCEQLIEDRLIADITSLEKTLSKQDQHFFNCLSWLISKKRLSIVAIVPKNNIGIAHQKYGIFSDKNSDRVAFNGSLNFSENALLNNTETIDCYKSWTAENERVEYYNALFRKTWTGQNKSVRFISIEKIKTSISQSFPASDINELLQTELSLIEEQLNIETPGSKKLKQLKEKIQKSKLASNPIDTSDIKPREYQKEAIDNWIKAGYKGFFEMATGTGKTFTGLFASLSLKSKTKKCFS